MDGGSAQGLNPVARDPALETAVAAVVPSAVAACHADRAVWAMWCNRQEFRLAVAVLAQWLSLVDKLAPRQFSL